MFGIGATSLAVSTSGCGYLLHKDRRGQSATGAKLDPMIIVLDGLLCLVGLLPGIIAFAVDVSSRCIYLPGDDPLTSGGFRVVPVPGGTQSDYGAALSEALGFPIELDDRDIRYITAPRVVTAEELATSADGRHPSVPSSEVFWTTSEQGDVLAATTLA